MRGEERRGPAGDTLFLDECGRVARVESARAASGAAEWTFEMLPGPGRPGEASDVRGPRLAGT